MSPGPTQLECSRVLSLGEILKMAKDDSTARCFQGLLIFGNVIVGVSNEYFSGNSVLSVITIFGLIESGSLKENHDILTGFLSFFFLILGNVLAK